MRGRDKKKEPLKEDAIAKEKQRDTYRKREINALKLKQTR